MKNKVNFEIKPSDIELFNYLFRVKVATREQLTRDCYRHLKKEAIYKRLRKFSNQKLLQNSVAPGLGNRRIYSITKRSFIDFVKKGTEEETQHHTSRALKSLSGKLGQDHKIFVFKWVMI